jgi:integration host factor subunit alpha
MLITIPHYILPGKRTVTETLRIISLKNIEKYAGIYWKNICSEYTMAKYFIWRVIMTKSDIVERLHINTPFSSKESSELLETILTIMKTTLESGENLKISGFGNFVVKQKGDRRGRNPQTGEAITIESRRILTFKPSGILKDKINKEPVP